MLIKSTVRYYLLKKLKYKSLITFFLKISIASQYTLPLNDVGVRVTYKIGLLAFNSEDKL